MTENLNDKTETASTATLSSAEPTQSSENVQSENPQEINWKKFRENREKERKEREEIEKDRARKSEENAALKAAIEALTSQTTQRTAQSENGEETEEQRLKRQIKDAIEEREKANAEERAQREQKELPTLLERNHTDFNAICSNENLDYLEFHFPEISTAFKNLPDTYEKWSNIYKTVKKLVPNPSSGKEQKKAERNFNKPQSMSVPGATTTTDSAPNMLNDKKKHENWLRMQRRMKGLT